MTVYLARTAHQRAHAVVTRTAHILLDTRLSASIDVVSHVTHHPTCESLWYGLLPDLSSRPLVNSNEAWVFIPAEEAWYVLDS